MGDETQIRGDISNKTIVVLVVLTVIISILSTLVVLNEVNSINIDNVAAPKTTAKSGASSTGQVSLTILPRQEPSGGTGMVSFEILDKKKK